MGGCTGKVLRVYGESLGGIRRKFRGVRGKSRVYGKCHPEVRWLQDSSLAFPTYHTGASRSHPTIKNHAWFPITSKSSTTRQSSILSRKIQSTYHRNFFQPNRESQIFRLLIPLKLCSSEKKHVEDAENLWRGIAQRKHVQEGVRQTNTWKTDRTAPSGR